jgi:hypothetical protein
MAREVAGKTHAEWARENFDRLMAESSERDMSAEELVICLATMCGTLIARDVSPSDHARILALARRYLASDI